MSDDEWLDMTPRQLQALRQRHLQTQQREELLVGIIASTTANFSFCRPDKALSPESFMLQPIERKPEREGPLTGERLMSLVRALPHQFITKQVQ